MTRSQQILDAYNALGSYKAVAEHLGITTSRARSACSEARKAIEMAMLFREPRSRRKHLVVPDTQCKPGVPMNHAHWLAHYAMDKLTNDDVVVFLGDVYDFPSLSSYDKRGSIKTEGLRLADDLAAGDRFIDAVGEAWDKAGFKPTVHVTLGNHEERLDRCINDNPHFLEGLVGADKFAFAKYNWQVHPFLKPIEVDGIRYCHYFPQNSHGKVLQTKAGAPNALAQVQRQMCSATAGHTQGLDVAIVPAGGRIRRGLIAGSYYLHDEAYIGPAELNNYWRGLLLCHGVQDGEYNLCEVDIRFLEEKYRKFEPKPKPKVVLA